MLTIASEFVRDVRVVPIAQVLDGRMVENIGIEQRGEVLESLISTCDGRLREFAQRHLLGIVVHIRHGGVNVLLVENQLNQRLDGRCESAFCRRRASGALAFDTVSSWLRVLFFLLLVLFLRVRLVRTLEKDVRSRLGGKAAILPSQTRFSLESRSVACSGHLGPES